MNEDNAIFFQPERPDIDTLKLFNITTEGEYLRVENSNVNLLYYELTVQLFSDTYNFLNKFLAYNFSPIIVNGKKQKLSEEEQNYLEQATITSSIYFYAVNKLKIILKPGKISLKIPFDDFLALLDKKYGTNSQISFFVGASVLRRPVEDFRNSVLQRRQYYNK